MATRRRCNNYLPEEIMFIILSLLPVKTLIQFKTVCKSWRFMISNIQFVQTHLTNSQKKRPVLLNYRKNYKKKVVHIDVQYTPQDSYRLYLPPTVTDMDMHGIYSCDGLVCLYDQYCGVIYIWNPATRQLKMLPAPNKDLSGKTVFLGLGLDPISNDYKLLRMGFKYHPGIEADLYSSKADSWKEIRIPETLQNVKPSLLKVVHAKPGILYLQLRSSLEILAFDLHEEVFRRYPFPHYAMSNILDFEGYVAMVLKSGDGSALSLFVLNDVCGKVSWTKLFDLEGNVKISRVVGYLGSGEFVILIAGDGTFTYNYDYRTRETKKYALKLTGTGMSAVIKYTESLVSLNGFEQQDKSGK